MKNNNEFWEELQHIAPKLAEIERITIQQVPENYFAQLREQILDKTVYADSSLIDSVSLLLAESKKTKPEPIPFFFSGLQDSVMAKIRREEIRIELSSIAPALAAISKTNIHTIPATYFEKNKKVVLSQIKNQNVVADISLVEKVNQLFEKSFGWLFQPKLAFVWSGAFSIAIIAALFILKPGFQTASTSDCAELACLNEKEIQQYINSNMDEFDEDLLSNDTESNETENKLNPTEIEQFLKSEDGLEFSSI